MRPAPKPKASLLPWIALAILAVVPYLTALPDPILHDDRVLLRNNAWIASQANAVTVFGHDFWFGTGRARSDLYRPVTILSLAWNSRLSDSPMSFRAVNSALHAGVTLCVAWVLSLLLSVPDGDRSPPPVAAWIGAAVFAVHPLASEAVLWIVGRAEMLAAGFGLLAFGLFIRLGRRQDLGGGALALSATLFFLALCSKESAAAWLVIGAIWCVVRSSSIETPRPMLIARSTAYAGAFGLFFVLRTSCVGWGKVATVFVDNPLVAAGTLTRWANAVLLLGFYAIKAIFPIRLSIDWAFDEIPVVPLVPWGGLAAVLLLVMWGGVAALLWRRSRLGTFLFLFFPAGFAVTGNIVTTIGTNFAERLAYLPLVGFCGLAGYALASLGWSRREITACVAALVVLWGARTAARGLDYRSAEALYAATARATPRAVKSLVSLGLVRLHTAGRPDLAIPPLERAVAIWPDYPRALNLLAEAYARTGDDERARDYAARAEAAAAKLREMFNPGAGSPGAEGDPPSR